MILQIEQAHDRWEFLMVQLDDGCELHRLCENFDGIEVLPQVDVENSNCGFAQSQQKSADGPTTAF